MAGNNKDRPQELQRLLADLQQKPFRARFEE
jgi:hypothetical protein